MRDSELKKFASWFHQDFGVIFKSIEVGTEEYLKTLSSERKKILVIELSNFLSGYAGKDSKGLKNAWIRLGAQWWDREKSPELLKNLVEKS